MAREPPRAKKKTANVLTPFLQNNKNKKKKSIDSTTVLASVTCVGLCCIWRGLYRTVLWCIRVVRFFSMPCMCAWFHSRCGPRRHSAFFLCFFFFNADICVLTTEEGEPPPLCHSASTLQWWRNATLHPRPLPFKIRSFAWALRKCRSCWPASNSTRLAVQFVDFYPRNLKQAST